MGRQFEPVKVGTIKQGKFLKALQSAFDEAQATLIEHVSEHGISAEAVVEAKIKIKCDVVQTGKAEHGDHVYGIASEVQVKPPKKPVQFSTAFLNNEAERGQCLFAPSGGSATGNPRQQLIRDPAGEPVAS